MQQLDNQWIPFTANRYFKKKPKLFTASNGMYYTDIEGNQVLDGTAGLWCVNAGHNQPHIQKAIQQQAEKMDYAPGFQLGHPLAFEFAEKLASIAPEPLNRVFFTNSGSEAADTALKIVMAYYAAKGETDRTLLVGRERAYHGVGFGGISIGGLLNNQKHFKLLDGIHHLPHTHHLTHNAFTKGLPEWGAHLADSLKTIADEHGKIAAVMVEPLAGSTGVLLPPKGYLKKLRQYCDQLGALLIFDEVITGFGRVGQAFAAFEFDVTPDIITCAKGLTNGAVPMGAVIVRDDIYDTVVDSAFENQIEFFHGYTYSGHPLACAAGLASLDVYQDQRLFERAAVIGPLFEEAVHSLKDLPFIKDIRNYGLVAAIELESRLDSAGARAMDVFHKAFYAGLLIRVTGDIIALSPPLIIDANHIDFIFTTLAKCIAQVN